MFVSYTNFSTTLVNMPLSRKLPLQRIVCYSQFANIILYFLWIILVRRMHYVVRQINKIYKIHFWLVQNCFKQINTHINNIKHLVLLSFLLLRLTIANLRENFTKSAEL